MKKDPIYKYYIFYLEQMINENRISNGHFSLLKISEHKFNNFKITFEKDELFNKNLIESYKREMRDKKIDDIFNEID